MAITLLDNRITCDTGTITMDVLYNESVAQGWSPAIEKFGSTFICPYYIYITGDANFYLGYTVQGEVLDFTIPTYLYPYALQFSSTGICRIGRKDFRINGAVINGKNIGGNLHRRYYLSGNVIVANTTFIYWWYAYIFGSSTSDAYIYDSMFNHTQFGVATNEYTNIDGFYAIGGYYGSAISDFKTGNNINISDSSIAMIVQGLGEKTLKGVVVNRSNTYDTFLKIGGTTHRLYNFVDCKVNKEKIAFWGSVTTGSWLSRQTLKSTFNFKTDINATINVYNNVDKLVYSGLTDINGEVTSEISYYIKEINGEGTDYVEIIEDYEPFKVIISKPNYETTTIEDVYVVAGQPTIIRETLKKQVPVMINIGTGESFIKLKPENVGTDREFLI